MRQLRDLATHTAIHVMLPNGTQKVVPVARVRLTYLLDPSEPFARFCAQYVALRSNSAIMSRQVQTMVSRARSSPVWYPSHWEDEDHEPIAVEFDALFRRLRWIQ